MSSQYPEGLDVHLRPEDEVDTPDAGFFNMLFSGMRAIQETLGTDPSDLGTGFSAFTDIAGILKALSRVEIGRFTITRPLEEPIFIPFASGTNRFTDDAKTIVVCARVNDGAGRVVPQNIRYSAVVQNSGGVPNGFDFRRWLMDDGDNTEDWVYLAMEDAL